MPIYTDYQTALVDAFKRQMFINDINRRISEGEVLSDYDYEALACEANFYFEDPEVPECIEEYAQEGSILFNKKQRATYRENLSDAYARTAEEEARELIGGGATDQMRLTLMG